MQSINFEFDVPLGNVRNRLARGALMAGSTQLVRVLTQLGSVIVLSRLLTPSDFGTFAMATPLLALAALVQDLGLGQASIQKDRITHADVNYLFWIGLLSSCGAGLALILVSPLVGLFYHNEKISSLSASLSVVVALGGLGTQHTSLLTRRMQFGVLAVLDGTAALVGLVVSCAVGIVTHSYWAIYFGALSSTLISAVGPWLCISWRPSKPQSNRDSRKLLHFGAGVTGFNLANFLGRNLDAIFIGRAWGGASLGLYDRAYKLLLLPIQQVTNPLARVVLPILSRLLDNPERYQRVFLRTMSQVLFLTLPGVSFMIASADRLIPILLGSRWGAAVPIFVALGFAGLVQPLNNPAGWLLMSQARTRDFMWCGVSGAISTAISVAIGLPNGPFGVAVAYAAAEIIRTPLLWLFICRKGPVRLGQVVRMATPHVLGALLSLLAVWSLPRELIGRPFLELTLAAFVSYAISLAVAAIFPASRRSLVDGISVAREFAQAKTASPLQESHDVR